MVRYYGHYSHVRRGKRKKQRWGERVALCRPAIPGDLHLLSFEIRARLRGELCLHFAAPAPISPGAPIFHPSPLHMAGSPNFDRLVPGAANQTPTTWCGESIFDSQGKILHKLSPEKQVLITITHPHLTSTETRRPCLERGAGVSLMLTGREQLRTLSLSEGGSRQQSMELTFQWDEAKAKANLQKHKVSFHEAKTVFNDSFLMTFPDPEHSAKEERYVNIGMSSKGRVLVVIHTERQGSIRLLSSRKATPKERKVYEGGG